jgi:hypothetical protein
MQVVGVPGALGLSQKWAQLDTNPALPLCRFAALPLCRFAALPLPSTPPLQPLTHQTSHTL